MTLTIEDSFKMFNRNPLGESASSFVDGGVANNEAFVHDDVVGEFSANVEFSFRAVGAVHDSCKTVEFVGIANLVAAINKLWDRGSDMSLDGVEFDFARIQRMNVFPDILPPNGAFYADAIVLVVMEF